jgi:TolB-like protein
VAAACRICRLGSHVLDLDRARLLDASGAEVPLRPKAFEVLCHLVAERGRVVSKEALFEAVWPGVIVTEDSLTQCIHQIRQALGADAPGLLRTLPKRGYLLEDVDGPMDPPSSAGVADGPRQATVKWAVGLVSGLALVVAAAWWFSGPQQGSGQGTAVGQSASVQPAAPETASMQVVDQHPTLAVLPFTNLNAEDANGLLAYTGDGRTGVQMSDRLADALTEDLITELTRVPELAVIALDSTLNYKGKPLDVIRVRDELGVRYLVRGSIQSDGDRLRVYAQLVDATSGVNLWADKYDQPRAGFFTLQDQLVNAIVGRVLPHVQETEKRWARVKPTGSLDAYDLFQRARSEKHTLTAQGLDNAAALLTKALLLDPGFADAYALLGYVNAIRKVLYAAGPPYDDSLANVQRALALNPNLSLGYQALSQVLSFMGRYEEAVDAGLKGIAISPNDAENHIIFARAASTVGRYQDAVRSAELAVELNPFYPKWYPFILSRSLYANGQFGQAAEVCLDGMARHPYIPTAVHCIASLARLGRTGEAREMTTRLLEMAPSMNIERASRSWGFREARVDSLLEADLRAGGVPEAVQTGG